MKKDSDSGVAAKNGQKKPARPTNIKPFPSSKSIKTPFNIIIEQTDEPDKMKLFF